MRVQCIDLPRIQSQRPVRQLRPMSSLFLLDVYGLYLGSCVEVNKALPSNNSELGMVWIP